MGETVHLDGLASDRLRPFLEASARLDPMTMARVLNDAAATIGVAVCIDELILPAMRQIGAWWAAGSYTIEQEVMTTEAVRTWLDELSNSAPVPTHRRPVFLACGPRDRHTLAGEALALLLRLQGWHCRVLGARISAASLMFAVAATPPAAVVVTSHLAAHRSHALPAITAVHDSGTNVFYAGNAFASSESREQVPGIYLGNHIADACTMIRRVIEPHGATSSVKKPHEI